MSSNHGIFFFSFFSQFCDVATLAIIHKKELAYFGYMLTRKVNFFNNPAIFWQHYETYCLNMAISKNKIKNPQNLMILVQFFGLH
jgi:hypothetical protein